jgi:hypothetical protein
MAGAPASLPLFLKCSTGRRMTVMTAEENTSREHNKNDEQFILQQIKDLPYPTFHRFGSSNMHTFLFV